MLLLRTTHLPQNVPACHVNGGLDVGVTLEVVVHRLVDHADLGGVEANQFGAQLFDAAPDPGSVAGKVVWAQGDNLSIPEG